MLTVKIPPFQNAQLKKKTLQFSVKLLTYFIEALIKPSNPQLKIKIGADGFLLKNREEKIETRE